jgi:hypothetical protein
MTKEETKLSCEIKVKDKNSCLKLMVVDEAKTDMEYSCSGCK